MKILITTQYLENYGTQDEPYWKAKGGNEYFVPVPLFRQNDTFSDKNLEMIVDSLRDRIEYANAMAEEHIIDWSLVADDYVTDFERSQLEYEGQISFPATVLELETA